MTLNAVVAANRFGQGARPGELQRARDDARGWLQKQVTGPRSLPEEIRRLPSSAEVFKTYSELRRERNDAKSDSEAAKRLLGGLRAKLAPYYLDQVAARYRVAVKTDESYRERLVHFWTNHFAVSADKPQVLALAGTLENEAIRPHVAGRFADMLAAVEAHPAMILYLDNQASIGPASQLAQRRGRRAAARDRKLGINENLAREILELHTLGERDRAQGVGRGRPGREGERPFVEPSEHEVPMDAQARDGLSSRARLSTPRRRWRGT